METKNWSAWIDLMPPGPKTLHVQGEVRVGTPTSKAVLSPKVPPGINPTILQLDLKIEPHAGPAVMTWVKARYDVAIAPGETAPSQVEIISGGKSLATMSVKEVH
jgi:hypothetical protein